MKLASLYVVVVGVLPVLVVKKREAQAQGLIDPPDQETQYSLYR